MERADLMLSGGDAAWEAQENMKRTQTTSAIPRPESLHKKNKSSIIVRSMDKLTPSQRHKTMSHIHGKNTKPEMLVRRYLFAHGFRYRVNVRRLPGTPDIVLRKYRTAIFIHGCFWHGHQCLHGRMPKTNEEFWKNKIERNKERDTRVREELRTLGWRTMVVWECQLKPKEREATLRGITTLLYGALVDKYK